MRIAFPTRDYRTISGHFGKMKSLLVLDIDNGVEVGREERDMSEMPPCGDGHGDKPRFLSERLADCDVLIAGGMGTSIADRLEATNTEVVLTDIRMIDKALASYLSGSIEHKPQLAHGSRTRPTQQTISRAPASG
jgi:predicted Fe-Mo cluster-binding NifX family protein